MCFYPLTLHVIQLCYLKIASTFKAHYRTGLRRNVIDVTDACLVKEFGILRAHEIAKKITAFESLHLVNEAWNGVSEITIQTCFQHGGFIFSQKEVEPPVVRPTDLSAELHDEWTNIDKDTRTTKL